MGAALFFMSATISADVTGLTIAKPGHISRLMWEEVERVAEGGGNLVFYSKRGRATAPSFEFWVGPEKAELIALLSQKLDERNVPFRSGSLRASTHVGDR
jgi:hypothetical protein